LSVSRQTYPHWEHIIVDDVSDQDPLPIIKSVHGEKQFQFIRQPERLNRYFAYNAGMKAAKNDWIIFLDDDDEYLNFYLEFLALAIKKYPRRRLFNCGGLVTHRKVLWVRARGVVKFEQKRGCECNTGDIVNGQFVFHRNCLKKTGYMPKAINFYQGADMAKIPGYGSEIRLLGNPWGQDFFMFYKLTRHYVSQPIDIYGYVCNIRGSEDG